MPAFNIACTFGGKGGWSPQLGKVQYLTLLWQAQSPMSYTSVMLQHPIGAHKVFIDEIDWSADTNVKCDPEWVGTDKYYADQLANAGAQTLYRNASGFMKAWADTDAWRITRTYAELIKEQWDADLISERNLPYLAWAKGVNLWEDWWSTEFKRYWVKNQWTIKYHRGSYLGLQEHVSAVGGKLKRAVVPPAKTFLRPNLTDAERAAYVARFPQLRLYPYVARIQLPWVCYASGHSYDRLGNLVKAKNRFLNHMYPTIQDAGGRYTRTATLYDPLTKIETPLTVRKIANVVTGELAYNGFTPGVSAYDEEIVLPAKERVFYYLNQNGTAAPKKFFGGGAFNGIFLGKKPALRTITISRSGPVSLTQGKAIYETAVPSEQFINLLPEYVSQVHPIIKRKVYLDHSFLSAGYYLARSRAWQFIYERWYLFDPDRVPDYKKGGTYLDHTRFGIHKYTAEALIEATTPFSKSWTWMGKGAFMRGFLKPRNDEAINRLRRGVTASMAERDTVLIDTKAHRQVEVGDLIDASGRYTIGQYIPT